MPYEIHITQSDLSVEVIGFGENEATARRIYEFTTNALMREGHILIGKVENPLFVEVVQRGGPTLMFIELKHVPVLDIANICALFHLLALEVTQGRYLATGLVIAEVVKSEQLWATAEYLAIETTPKGTQLKHALAGDRTAAQKAFAEMVQARQNNGDTVRRNQDTDMKFSAMGKDGLTTFELVEVAQK